MEPWLLNVSVPMLGKVVGKSECDLDSNFIKSLYLVSRDYEFERADLPESYLRAFLENQFNLQLKHFKKQYQNLNMQVLWMNAQPIGRLYLVHLTDPGILHLVDITLIREVRNKSVGKAIIHALQKYSQELKVPLGLYVKHDNPAQRLYAVCGFVCKRRNNDHLYMEFV